MNLIIAKHHFKKYWFLYVVAVAATALIFSVAGNLFSNRIVNVHEHIKTVADAKRVLSFMRQTGQKTTVLLGSPASTFGGKSKTAATFDQNNKVILQIANMYPENFVAFCGFFQEDPQIVSKLRDCLANGAKGAKMFSGHGSFYTIPLDHPSLDPFYAELQNRRAPILWHVNTGKYLAEFEAVLQKYPRLRVICPHYCMASKSISRIYHFLDAYPSMIFDISFGAPAILEDGLQTISKKHEQFRELFIKYPGRFLFGTDVVLTKTKSKESILGNFRVYSDMLEKKKFTYQGKEYNGLNLPDDILKKIYYKNWEMEERIQ